MAHRSPGDTYRRRRHRSALLRRGALAPPPPACCRGGDGRIQVLPLVARWPEVEFETLLWGLTCRVTTYRAVRGMLYCRRADRVTVVLVAPCPMTRPLAILADVWATELDVTSPGLEWEIRVSEAAPENSTGYRCLFWRPS